MLDGFKVTIIQPEPPAAFDRKSYEQAHEARWPDGSNVLMAMFRPRGCAPILQWQISKWDKRNPFYPWTHFVRLPDEIPPHEPRESS